jgi:hypothetical protein
MMPLKYLRLVEACNPCLIVDLFTFYFQFCDGVQVTQKNAQRRFSQWLYT